MICNQNLDRLIEVDIVQRFMSKHHMQGKACREGENCSFIIYRLPYVIEFRDALIENYLEISLSNLDSMHLIQGGVALGYSLNKGLQSLDELRGRSFVNHPLKDIFLSEQPEKMRYLHSHLEALDKLFPLIEENGDLTSSQHGKFDLSKLAQPMYLGLKERYKKCIESTPA